MSKNSIEWVIHVWGQKRETLELNYIEKFHIDMLKSLQSQQKKFDKILINIALDDVNDMNLFNFLKSKIEEVIVIENVEFKFCQNDPRKGEYVTFRPYVFDRIGEDVDIFYSHFKGYASHVVVTVESYPYRVICLSELFWSYIMYKYLLNVDDVKKKLKDKCAYCWFIQKFNEGDENSQYYQSYLNKIKSINETFNDYTKFDMNKHSPGSFAWYNMKRIGDVLKDKEFITSVKDDELENMWTHFCEIYLQFFLPDDECYAVNDFNNESKKIGNMLYTSIYVSKLFGKEYIDEFNEYLIKNKWI